jgi:CRP/FNR family cyclic AMP-dependent transcriptional regulator
MAVQLDLLKKLDYFSDLDPAELDSISKFVAEQRIEEGEVFLSEGKNSIYMYFIMSGVVKIYKSSAEGRDQVLNMAVSGESLNDVSTFNSNTTAASCSAMTSVILYKIRKKDMKIIVQKHPRVALNALKVLASKVRRDALLVRDFSFSNITGRLAKMLLRYFTGADMDAWPRLTQHDMAAIVGTTREVVNRSLKDMEGRGAIRLDRHGVAIINKDILEKMVE